MLDRTAMLTRFRAARDEIRRRLQLMDCDGARRFAVHLAPPTSTIA